MKRTLIAAAVAMCAVQPRAEAHVAYFDLSANLFVDPSGASWDQEYFNNYGWSDGTRPTLGDSHNLAGGVFFKFHLGSTARVDISFVDASTTGLLNPAFSLYGGLLPDDAHDDAGIDPLNPSHLVLTPVAHAVKDPSPVDNGSTTDLQGNVSPFRDTANVTFLGQFNALGDWSMANELGDTQTLAEAIAAGNWSVVKYIAHVAPTGGSSVALLGYLLPAGDYTIAAGGGTAGGEVGELLGTVSFKASPVPLPAGLWLMGGALTGLLRHSRRRVPA